MCVLCRVAPDTDLAGYLDAFARYPVSGRMSGYIVKLYLYLIQQFYLQIFVIY